MNAYNLSEDPAEVTVADADAVADVAVIGVGKGDNLVVGDVERDLTLSFDFGLRNSNILVSIIEVSSSAMELDLFLDGIINSEDDFVAEGGGGGVGVDDDAFEWVVVVDAVAVVAAVVVVVVDTG